MTEKNKKILNYSIIGALGIGALYLIFAKKSESGGGVEDPTGNGTTIPNSTEFNAATVATKLYDAMKEIGTKPAQIFNALTNVNQVQFGKVITAFGKRSYNDQLGNQINFNPFFALPLHNLKYWLESELDEEHYETLRQQYPNYL